VVLSAGRDIIAASAECDGDGVLFYRYVIDDEFNNVKFYLIAHEGGLHQVRMSVADSETMFAAFYDLEIEVKD